MNKQTNFKSLYLNKKVLVAILVISLIAGVGSLQVWRSSAATYNKSYSVFVTTNSKGCYLAGRAWDSTTNKCKDAVCRDAADIYKTKIGSDGIARGYCEGHIWVTTNVAGCINTYHRYYVTEVGCARRADRDMEENAKQCIPGYPTYVSKDAGDTCIAPKVTTAARYSTSFDTAVHDRINLSRTNKGLRALPRSTGCLEDFARASAKRMAENNYMNHATNLKEALSRCNLAAVGENIAVGFDEPNRLVSAWYASPTHYQNMMNTRWNSHAIVSFKSAEGHVFTASWFADPK